METPDQEEVQDEKPRTLFVGNIPRQVSKRDLETVFGEAGPLKRCFIQYPRKEGKYRADNDDTTVAYVTYALPEDAIKALENLNGYKFGSNKISLKLAKSRTEQHREGRYNFYSTDVRNIQAPVEKRPRPKVVKKKSRLIIRNLSFEVNEDNLRNYFESYGKITDMNILRKPNGKLVGCAFVQYATVPEAARAIRELNAKPFLGRPIAIDWALPKEKFQGNNEEDNITANQEENDNQSVDPEIKIKIEPPDNYDYIEDSLQMKVEQNETDKSDDDSECENNMKQKKRKHQKDKLIDSDGDDDGVTDKKRKINPDDADEGKTLFIRNLEFETTADELKTFFSIYGPLNYAVICKDKLTEHPKGTAFVMYKDPADACKCLEDYGNEPSKFTLGRRNFTISMALSKTKLETKLQSGVKKEPKDKRNLYLAREGYIRPESNAAIGVSAADMNKRTAIQRVKRQMLKNLSIFISDTRLCVHNLPPSLTDSALRKVFSKHGGAGAKVTEARIMRDLLDKGLDGIGRSKEYGFVSFTTHDHALKALRSINNNPKIFTPSRRPIVEFSLENRAAIKAKEKRAEKSREKNSTHQAKVFSDSNDDVKTIKKKGQNVLASEQESNNLGQYDHDDLPSYSGLTSKVGISSLPSLKPKGKISRKSLKPLKSKSKNKLQPRRNREPQIKPKIKNKEDQTEKLISRHQKKLKKTETTLLKKKKSKWYQ